MIDALNFMTTNEKQTQIENILTTEANSQTEDIRNRQLQTAKQRLIVMTPSSILLQLCKYNAQISNHRLTQSNPPSYNDSTIVGY